MSNKFNLIILFLTCSIHAIAQTDYYYYEGKKIPLTINEDRVCVNVPKSYQTINEKIRANVQVLVTIKDDSFYIMVITRSDYEKLTTLDSWEEDSKFVILTTCYYTKNNAPVVASPYLDVELKKEQDTVLLASYMKEYKLKISYHSRLMPLWYILAVTPDSPKNSVECANELFEYGDFQAAVADFVDVPSWVYESAVQIIPATPTKESTVYYDMLGRRTENPSGLTIVVTRYSDGTVRTEKKLFLY